jgi:hypothetical protein
MRDADEPGEDHDSWAERLRVLSPFAQQIREPGFGFGSWHAQDAVAVKMLVSSRRVSPDRTRQKAAPG